MTFETNSWEPVPIIKSPDHASLSALRFGVILGVILLFSGGLVGLFVDFSWPRYAAMIGAILWAFCGTWAVVLRKRREKNWSEI